MLNSKPQKENIPIFFPAASNLIWSVVTSSAYGFMDLCGTSDHGQFLLSQSVGKAKKFFHHFTFMNTFEAIAESKMK